MKYILYCLLPVLLWGFTDRAAGVELHVRPTGADTNPGTHDEPFRTLTRARDAVRELQKERAEDMIVHLHPGTYPVTEPLVLTERDSGRAGHRVVYRSYAGIGTARLVGGRALRGWTRRADGVWAIELPADALPHTLYEQGRRARKARHPNYGHDPKHPAAAAPYFASEDGSPLQEKGKGNDTSWIVYRGDQLDPGDVLDIESLKINVFPWGKCDWHRWICPVTEMCPAERKILFDNRGDVTQILGKARYFLEDHRSFLDAPGEFYVDQANRTLLYLPYGDRHPDDLDIVMPVVLDLIRLEGAAPDQPVHDVVFEGLSLEYSDALSPTIFWWKHGWGRTDHALIWMSNTRNVEVRHCHLKNSGRSGIMMVGENTSNRVEGCWIEQTGVNGITLSNWASNPYQDLFPLLRLEHNVLTNNRIHDVGQLSLYCACINLYGASHNEVSSSELYRSPRYAITMRGNTTAKTTRGEEPSVNPNRAPGAGNVFRHLRIHDCGQDSGDMGAVHAAMVNLEGGDSINVFEQITIENTHAVAGMNDIPPDGIFLDWPGLTMHQVFRDFHIVDSQGLPFRSNGPANAQSAVTDNVSWKPGFDDARMAYGRIGLLPDFPSAYGGPGSSATAPEAPTELSAEPVSHHALHLTWRPPSGHDAKTRVYTVYRDGQPLTTTAATRFVDTGLTERTTYRYVVRARNGKLGPKSEPSAECSITTPPDITPPAIQRVHTDQTLTRISVLFSEPVAAGTATAALYALSPKAKISGSEALKGRPDVVVLSMASPLNANVRYTLTASGLRDRAASPNTMDGTLSHPFVPARLVVHYPLDAGAGDTVVDVSGNQRHGVRMPGASWSSAGGKIGGALVLDGASGWVRCPPEANLGSGDFTLMAWVYKRSSGIMVVLAKGNGFEAKHEWSWGWIPPDGRASIAFRNLNHYWSTLPDSLPAKQWVHLAFVKSGHTGLTYIDGQRVGEPEDLSHLADLTNPEPLRIGRREHDPSPAYFNGRLDDIRIYAEALSPERIRACLAGR